MQNNQAGHGLDAKADKWTDILAVSGIFVICTTVYMLRHNVDFYGFDEYRCLRLFVRNFQFDVIPNIWTSAGLVEWIKFNFEVFFCDIHGPIPGLIIGPIYFLFDLLHIPITKPVMDMPSAVFAALTCCLFYYLLRQEKFNLFFSLAGSALLAFCPLYLIYGRTGFGALINMVVFNQLAVLILLRDYTNTRRNQWLLGIVLVNIVLTENLSFLTIAAFIAALMLRDGVPQAAIHGKVRETGANLIEKLRPFKSWRIWLPASIALVMTAFFTFLTIVGSDGDGNFKYGYYATTFFRLIDEHSELSFDVIPSYLTQYLTFMMGEATIVLLPVILIVFIYLLLRRKINGVIPWFLLIAGLGFGFIWYVAFDDINDIAFGLAYMYHITQIIPFIMMSLYIGRYFIDSRSGLKPYVAGVLILLVTSTLLASLNIVCQLPTLLNPYANDPSTSVIQKDCWGTVSPNRGTKALGYLVRELMEWEAAESVEDTVKISGVQSSRAPRFDPSLGVYAGIIYNDPPEGRYGYKIENPGWTGGFYAEEDSILYLVLDFRNIPLLDKQNPQYENSDIFSRYDVVNTDDKLLGSIFIAPIIGAESNIKYLPGRYGLDSLECKFDAKYNRLNDFFFVYW